MAAQNYAECLERLLKHEGGYTNDPEDSGGPTNWGITIADARMYWKPSATAADVKAMPLSVAKSIYKSKYWDRMDCDNLPSGVDYCVFDYGVNSGVGRAGKILLRYTGSPEAVINSICDERMAFLRGLHNWPTFGKGWTRRVTEVRAFSLQLASVPVSPSHITAQEPPATIWQIISQIFRRK